MSHVPSEPSASVRVCFIHNRLRGVLELPLDMRCGLSEFLRVSRKTHTLVKFIRMKSIRKANGKAKRLDLSRPEGLKLNQ
jgi:hypothetical protein